MLPSRSWSYTLSLALILLAIWPQSARAGDEEGVVLGFVEQIAAGDAEALYDYIREHSAAALLARRGEDEWRALAARIARHEGLEVTGLDIDGRGGVQVETASPMGVDLFFTFEFDPEEPAKIASFSIQAGRPDRGPSSLPAFAAPPGATREQVVEALAAYLDDLGSHGSFSGTALVAWRGEPIYRGAWGLASREWNVANTVDTRFDLGSINKSFTRIAIGQLALSGKLRLTDTIADHLLDYPNAEAAAKVTIQHLLDHSSGIGDIFNERFFRTAKTEFREPQDFFPVFAEEPLRFEPGTSTAYSNGGFMVLGAIIAAVSGKTYSEYVGDHVFEPAGMGATGFFARDEIVPKVAVGYTRMGRGHESGELRNNLFRLSVRGSSAGSAFSTVDDLLAFDNALREHRLLPPAWTHWYFGGPEPQGDEEPSQGERSRVATGIAGGAPGVSAVVESDGDLTLIVLSNEDEPGAEVVSRTLRRPLASSLAEAR